MAPARVAAALRGWSGPWGIAGGWALDLLRGDVTRPHHDVEIAIRRSDQQGLRQAFVDWSFCKVVEGKLCPWPSDEWLSLPVHEVHARTPEGLEVEVLLNEWDGDWVFRRDTRIRRSGSRWLRVGVEGLPVLAPEIVLLYKAKHTRPRDRLDFETGLALLDDEARAWLHDALRLVGGPPEWIETLGLVSGSTR